VRCAEIQVEDARRDKPSLCPLPGCVEDASLTPRLRSLVAWLQRFFRREAGDDKKVGADGSICIGITVVVAYGGLEQD
jgi:hypothetical protein